MLGKMQFAAAQRTKSTIAKAFVANTYSIGAEWHWGRHERPVQCVGRYRKKCATGVQRNQNNINSSQNLMNINGCAHFLWTFAPCSFHAIRHFYRYCARVMYSLCRCRSKKNTNNNKWKGKTKNRSKRIFNSIWHITYIFDIYIYIYIISYHRARMQDLKRYSLHSCMIMYRICRLLLSGRWWVDRLLAVKFLKISKQWTFDGQTLPIRLKNNARNNATAFVQVFIDLHLACSDAS